MISQKPVNENNFLRWYPAQGETLPAEPALFCGGRPENAFFLPLVPGDEISFFINANTPLNIVNPAELIISFMQRGELVGPGWFLNRVGVENGFYLYGTYEMPNLPDGYYNAVIYRPATMEILFVSNPVEFVQHQNWADETHVIKYRNAGNIYHFQYEALPGFFNQFRLPADLNDEQQPSKTTVYTDTFSGKTYHAKPPVLDLTIVLQLYGLDRAAHRAAAAALIMHLELYISGTRYLCTDGYERENEEYDNSGIVSNGKAKLLDANFTSTGIVCI